MKMRKRKAWSQSPHTFDVSFQGELIRRFYTIVSARRFADVSDRLRMGEDEWEEYQQDLARLEAMKVYWQKQRGANNVRGT